MPFGFLNFRNMVDGYVRRSSVKSFALVAAALTGLLSLLELVEQLASVGQGHYRLEDALVYVALTAPGRFLQITPVSMLLGVRCSRSGRWRVTRSWRQCLAWAFPSDALSARSWCRSYPSLPS